MINLEKYVSSYLWKGLDILRGYFDSGVAQRIYIECLFIKLLNEELTVGNSYFTNKIKGRLDFDVIRNNPQEFLKELDEFIHSNEILDGLFSEISRLREINENRVLGEFLSLFNEIHCSEYKSEIEDGSIFRYFIDVIFRSSKINTKTSPSINLLISRLLENIKMKSIYDPTIGTGSLITKVTSIHDGVEIYGQDINNDMVSICKMLLILEERIEDVTNIYQGNTLVNPGNVYEGELQKFDCIVCNPAFALKDWGYNEVATVDKYNRFHRGLPSKSLGDYAFITHVVECLNYKGRAIMVEPSGVLFREGAEGAIREQLIKENIIDCIIALPNNMMYGTALPVNLLIFNMNKFTEDILFIDVTKKVESSKRLTTLSDEIMREISNIYECRLSIEGFSRVVNINELENNNCNLNVQRYIEDTKVRDELNIIEINNNIRYLQDKLSNIQNEISRYFNNI